MKRHTIGVNRRPYQIDARGYGLCIENNGESIRHLLNQTQAIFLARQVAQVQSPPGRIIPRNIGITDVGRTFSICGIVVMNRIGTGKFVDGLLLKLLDE
jgi:hypothetical protein